MMSIRSLADFNGAPLGGAVTGWHRHRHRPGPTLRVDTTKEGWGLLPGHQRGPTPGHQRGLSHGHGQRITTLWTPDRAALAPSVPGLHPIWWRGRTPGTEGLCRIGYASGRCLAELLGGAVLPRITSRVGSVTLGL